MNKNKRESKLDQEKIAQIWRSFSRNLILALLTMFFGVFIVEYSAALGIISIILGATITVRQFLRLPTLKKEMEEDGFLE